MNAPVLLVARANPEAAQLARRLRRAGLAAVGVTLFRRDLLPDPSFGTEPFDLLVPSRASAGAVPALLPPDCRVLALAPRTLEALRARGIRVDVSSEKGAAHLAALARPGVRLLVLTSSAGGEEVRRLRPDAEIVVAYRLRPVLRLRPAILTHLHEAHAWLLASPSGVDTLNSLLPRPLDGRDTVLALGTTTEARLRPTGARVVPVRAASLLADTLRWAEAA